MLDKQRKNCETAEDLLVFLERADASELPSAGT